MRQYDHWIALGAAMLFVAMQHREKPMIARATIAGVSGAMGHSVAPEMAASLSIVGPLTWTVLITAFGYAALDVALALISDRESIREIARGWLGRRK